MAKYNLIIVCFFSLGERAVIKISNIECGNGFVLNCGQHAHIRNMLD